VRRRYIVLVIITFINYTALFSQVQIGIKGGLITNWNKADDFINPGYNYKLSAISDLNVGFNFGLFSQFKLFNVLIQPEVLFTSVQNNLEYEDLRYNEVKKVRQEFNKLDIPVLGILKYKIIKLELGPVASILLEEKSFLFDEIDYKQKFRLLSLGYQAGIGLDISKIAFDIRYEGNLTRFGDLIEIGGERFDYNSHPRQLVMSFGVFF
jgi:hypothetical protein